MSLPWFPFHIDKFLSDTMELDGPAVGAYALLMLHYYATEKPPRDNDRTLATIARLPIEVWNERRPEIEAFFQIRDGAWHHDTIEAEIAEAKLKHAAGIARATAGASARWARTPAKPATSKRQAVPQASSELAATMKTAQSNATVMPNAMPKQSLTDAHSTITDTSLSVCSDVAVEKDNSGDNSDDQERAGQEESLGAQVDPQFWPCENHITVCNIDGADAETIKREVGGFIATHQERSTFSRDWDATWSMWWKRWRDHRDAQAAKKAPKPRVEVSNAPPDWNAHAIRWANGMGWPRGVGGEPGSARCRCPPEVLTANGIDPATGLKLVPEKV